MAWRVGTGRRARLVRAAVVRAVRRDHDWSQIRAQCARAPSPTQEEEKELPHFWFPYPGDGYALGEVLHHDQDTDNMNVRLKLEAGPKVRTRRSIR